jgi:uncharacterized protein YeaO (DUF488 family)
VGIKLQLKRVYDQPTEDDGARFLVERLWPRGIKKSLLADAQWLRNAAPSAELRKWFHDDPGRWNEFRRRYFAELKRQEGCVSPILEAARKGAVTLLYSSHDSEHNNAVALREFLEHLLEPTERTSCLCLQ